MWLFNKKMEILNLNNKRIWTVKCPKCSMKTLYQKWSGLKLFVICKSCGSEVLKGKFMFIDDRDGKK